MGFSFLFSLSLLTFIAVISQILKFLDRLLIVGADWSLLSKFVLLSIPSVLSITLPISYLISTLILGGRMNTDLEFLPILSSGISPHQFLKPLLLGALPIFILTFLSVGFGEPASRWGMKSLIMNAGKKRIHTLIEARSFNSNLFDIAVYVDEVSEDGTFLKGMMISDRREKRVDVTIFSKKGELLLREKETPILVLSDGSIHMKQQGKGYSVIDFETYIMDLSWKSKLFDNERSIHEQFPWELLKTAKDSEKRGESPWNILVEFHKKFSYPFAVFAFSLIGFPAGILGGRMSRMKGYIMSAVIVLIYYIFIRITEVYGGRGILPVQAGLWFPNLLFIGTGYILFRRVFRF